jgi:hypothetical protein
MRSFFSDKGGLVISDRVSHRIHFPSAVFRDSPKVCSEKIREIHVSLAGSLEGAIYLISNVISRRQVGRFGQAGQ